jgi:hypothetical protein
MCISNIRQRRPTGGTAAARAPINNAYMAANVSMKDDTVVPNGHIIVQHDYHDHSADAAVHYQEEHPARGGVTIPFPLKLHEMLDTLSQDGNDHIVSWQPHGRCFVVHKPKEFVELLPGYFKLSKLASFQRQLNLYGFQRLTRGRDRGGYYHELFLRNKVFLAHSIQRVKVKGTGVRARSNPDQEPDLWTMDWVTTTDASASTDASTDASASTGTADASSPSEASVSPPACSPCTPYLEMLKSSLQGEQDSILDFADRKFHYTDPFIDKWSVQGVDQLLANEAESFFEDFRFPDQIVADIEDDHVFCDMLEQMIA